MYIILLSILVFASTGYGEDTIEVLEKVNAGIEAGNAIVEIFSDDNLSETFGKIGSIATKIGPFLGAIGPAISLITIFLPSSPSPEMQFMKKKFTEMDEKLDKVFKQFDEVKNLIQETSLKGQYGEYEHTISALSYRLQQFLDAPPDAVQGQKATFISAYESTYGGAAYTLWRGMMEETVLSNNIPKTAIEYTRNHRGRVQKIMKGVENLILQGVKIHLSYLKAKGRDATYEDEKNEWETNIKELTKHMLRVDKKVKDAYLTQLRDDLNDKLVSLNGKSHREFADKFYAFVKEKYEWRDWFIVVYNKIQGIDHHWSKYCSGIHLMRKYGRNVVIASVDPKKRAINIKDTEKIFQRTATTYRKKVFFTIKKTSNKKAREIYDTLPSNIRNGCTYAGKGVIEKSANIEFRAPRKRLAVVTNVNYVLFAFG